MVGRDPQRWQSMCFDVPALLRLRGASVVPPRQATFAGPQEFTQLAEFAGMNLDFRIMRGPGRNSDMHGRLHVAEEISEIDQEVVQF